MRRTLAIAIVLAVAICTVYGQVVNHGFVSIDDGIYVSRNTQVQSGLTGEGVGWAFTTTYASNWHPLTWLSHMLDHELFGFNVGSHHLVSVFIHILNTLLLFFLLLRMTGAVWRSAMVAFLFAVHPLHVESVAWISERKDVLSTLFFMLTLLAYTWYAEEPKVTRYAFVFVSLALGLMAKPMLVTAPFVLLLLDYWPLERFQKSKSLLRAKRVRGSCIPRLLVEKIPLIALVIASSVVTFLAQRHANATLVNELIPFGYRVTNALVSYAAYLLKTLWPGGLAVFYPYRESISPVEGIGAFAVVAGISALVFGAGRKWRFLSVGWLWYLGTLVPVIGFIQIGLQSMADRYTYIPLIGIFIAVVWGFAELTSGLRHSRIFQLIAAGAVGCGCMVATGIQVGYWRNSATLFQHALDVTDNNYIAHLNLGQALGLQGDRDQEIAQYEKALKIRPADLAERRELDTALMRFGRSDETAKLFRKTLHVRPENDGVHRIRGTVLVKQGKREEALGHFREEVRLNPQSAEDHNNLGLVLAAGGNIDEAIVQFQEVIRIDPAYPEARSKLNALVTQRAQQEP